MMRYKALTIGLGLILCNQVLAFSSDCCIKGYTPGLSSPNLPGGFYFGFSGLSLKPTETNIGQATDSWQFLESDDPSDLVFRAEDRPFKPSSDWAWGAKVGYDLPCSSLNIEADYLHFNNKTHAVNTTDDGDPMSVSFASLFSTNALFPIDDPDVTSILSLRSDAHLRYKLDQFDLKIGKQFFESCGPFKLQASIGARYAYLDHALTFNSPLSLRVIVDDLPPLITEGAAIGAVKSHFKGIGPLGSLDLRYAFGRCGIGVVGHFDTGLLIGDTYASSFVTLVSTVVDPIVGPTTAVTNRFTRPSLKHVVPNLDAKLGLDYTFCFCNKSSLTVEVGYSAYRYWDAFNIIRGDISSTVDVPAQKITAIETNNFSVNGPYAEVSWHM